MRKPLLSVLIAFGLVPAQAAIFQYSVALDGPTEGVASPGIGTGTVNYDDSNHFLQMQVVFSGLLGTTTAAHIHAATAAPFSGTAGVATQTPSFVGFPLGVTSGSFANTLDLTQSSSWNPSYVSAHGGTAATAEADFVAAIAAGKAYFNIHTSSFGNGEIRGFLVAVPEPGTMALAGLGAAVMAIRVFRRKAGGKRF